MNFTNFFLNKNQTYIDPFSISHIILLIFTILFLIIIYKNQEKINLKKSRFILAFILIINWFLRRGSFIIYGVYNVKYNLDINFCNFTSVLTLLYCLTGNKQLYKYCSYLIFVGPLLSMIFPSSSFSIFNYSFYSFFIIHNLIFIFNYLFLIKENITYSKEDIKNIYLYILIYLLIVYIIDILFEFDYNMPSSFINMEFLSLHEFVIKKPITSYLIMLVVINILVIIANKILKYVKKV